MKFGLNLNWRRRHLVAIPVSLLFIYWAWGLVVHFYDFGIHYDSHFISYQMGSHQFDHLKKIANSQKSLSQKVSVTKSAPFKPVNLFVPSSKLLQLESEWRVSAFSNSMGGVLIDGKLYQVRVNHQGGEKAAIGIKTEKSQLFEGMRQFSLVASHSNEVLNEYVAFRLGILLDLIAPKTEMVNLSVNGKTEGLYILIEKLEELTLRNHNRIPGDLYAGEFIGDAPYRRIYNKLFDTDKSWKKIAINNHYPESSKKPLEKLIKLINAKPTEDTHAELSKLVDMEQFGRFSSLEVLTATASSDGTHNWRLYFDPIRRKFIPVVWKLTESHDFSARAIDENSQLDVITSLLHTKLHQNADFLRARDHALKQFYSTGLDQKFLAELTKLIADLELYASNNISHTNEQKNISVKQLILSLANIKNRMEKTFSAVRKAYFDYVKNDKYTVNSKLGEVALLLDGRSVVENINLEYSKPFENNVSGEMSFWVNGQLHKVDISGALRQKGSVVTVDMPLIASFVTNVKKGEASAITVGEAYYVFSFADISPDNTVVAVTLDRGINNLTRALNVASLNKKSFVDVFQIADNQLKALPLVWSGKVVVKNVQTIEQDLIIQAGTEIFFESEASLIIRAKLDAQGTKEKPIRFMQSNTVNAKPWGTVALTGRAADGSRLKYATFDGGSGYKDDLQEYTAMLSIHEVKDVIVEHVEFRNSNITDDMVHVVYSDVYFGDCLFEDSLLDALDVDISSVVIERCHFINSGNDSIDLMTSNAIVIDTVIENSVDKAASVGERSYLLAINDRFINNAFGVQAKDGSIAALYNIDLIGNDHALDAYKKNWRYEDGGCIFVYKSILDKNKVLITTGINSSIHVFDSYIDRPVELDGQKIKLDITVDNKNKYQAVTNKLVRYKKTGMPLKEFDQQYLDHIDINRRGVFNNLNN